MEELSQVKNTLKEVMQEIEWFKATRWDEEKSNPSVYSRELEELYIRKTKAELKMRQLELRSK